MNYGEEAKKIVEDIIEQMGTNCVVSITDETTTHLETIVHYHLMKAYKEGRDDQSKNILKGMSQLFKAWEDVNDPITAVMDKG